MNRPIEASRRGEVWMVDFDPTRGAEMSKIRPAIVLSRDSIGILPLRVVVPVTGWQEVFVLRPWMVRIEPDTGNGLSKASAADTFQVKSLSVGRMMSRLGVLAEGDLAAVLAAVAEVIGLP